MRSPKQFLATALFVLALGIPTFAGDMGGPTGSPVPAPTPVKPSAAAASTVDNTTSIEVTLNLLLAALSL